MLYFGAIFREIVAGAISFAVGFDVEAVLSFHLADEVDDVVFGIGEHPQVGMSGDLQQNPEIIIFCIVFGVD